MPLSVIPEANKPLPDDFAPEDASSFNGKVKVRAKTAQVLMDAGAEIPVSTQEKEVSEDIFKQFTKLDDAPPDSIQKADNNKALNVPAVVTHLTTLLTEYDQQLINDAVQLRRYITNRLLEESGPTQQPAQRMKALELLGKISDVGLFTEKTEVTVKNATLEDLEDKIRNKLYKILGQTKIIDASFEVIESDMGDNKEVGSQ